MKLKIAAVTIFVAWPLVASAEPISLTMAQVLDAVNALSALDGHDQVIKDGAVEKSVHVPYQFSGGARLAIAEDLRKLKAAVSDFQTARNAKIMELTKGGGAIKPGSPEEAELGKTLTDMLAMKKEMNLTRLTRDDLGLMAPSNNPIPPTDIAGLGDLLDAGPSQAAEDHPAAVPGHPPVASK